VIFVPPPCSSCRRVALLQAPRLDGVVVAEPVTQVPIMLLDKSPSVAAGLLLAATHHAQAVKPQ
jgi:hypothetical protein